jgi:hypothetical protein
VSYAWRIAGDALADLAELEPWLQEDVLDEVERVAAAPSAIQADADGFAAREVIRAAEGKTHVVFIRMLRDDSRRLVIVLGLSDQSRAREPGDV